MSKSLGLAIVAAGLLFSLTGSADAAVVTKVKTSRPVVVRNVRGHSSFHRRVNTRHVHHRHVSTSPRSNLNQSVARHGHRHFHNHGHHNHHRVWRV